MPSYVCFQSLAKLIIEPKWLELHVLGPHQHCFSLRQQCLEPGNDLSNNIGQETSARISWMVEENKPTVRGRTHKGLWIACFWGELKTMASESVHWQQSFGANLVSIQDLLWRLKPLLRRHLSTTERRFRIERCGVAAKGFLCFWDQQIPCKCNFNQTSS